MAKKDNKSHHDKGGTLNINRKEHSNSFIQRRDPRIHQQEIAVQNLAKNDQEGNKNYEEVGMKLAETAKEFTDLDFSPEDWKKED